MTRFRPADLAELRDAVATALAAGEGLELFGGGSKRGLGRPLQTPHVLDLSRLCGIRAYEPTELVLTAGAATPLAEIEQALAAARQMLAFEPPDWRHLWGESAGQTLGGVLACNLAGPRRIKTGAARDHFLGFRGVGGHGEIFKAGGKVVKNVTGYDLPKLLAGSYGTLAALEEVTVKVLPAPEATCTVLVGDLGPAAATAVMTQALASPHEVSGAAYLPPGLAPSTEPPPLGGRGAVAVRIEGPEASVAFRRDRLLAELPGGRPAEAWVGQQSRALWRAIGDARPLAGLTGHAVWRVSVAPARGAFLAQAVAGRFDARWYLDWGGGLVWLAIAAAEDGGAAVIRQAIRGDDGRGTGHATLVAATAGLRRAVPVFEPLADPLAALAARVKDAFDPRNILNPGRLTAPG